MKKRSVSPHKMAKPTIGRKVKADTKRKKAKRSGRKVVKAAVKRTDRKKMEDRAV